jgi:hypothetical protein
VHGTGLGVVMPTTVTTFSYPTIQSEEHRMNTLVKVAQRTAISATRPGYGKQASTFTALVKETIMNMQLNNFLKPGTSLTDVIFGITIILFFSAGSAGFIGWLSV